MCSQQPRQGHVPLIYGFIMAGGIGSRLWPRSRRRTPKQFLDLTSEKTMLQDAYARLLPLIPAERLLVGTGVEYVDAVREQLPGLPAGNIVAEPTGRGTAPAIGLGALHIHRAAASDPSAADAVMVVATADHHIGDAQRFRRIVRAAAQAALAGGPQAGTLVTFGITPDFASTGYGYIQRGDLLQIVDDQPVYRAVRFTEKPDAATARAFVESGMYSWNSGMFIWKVQAIRAEFERQMPKLWSQLCEIENALGTADEHTVLERVWAGVDKQTIDYGIMEGAANVAVIPASIGWNDIGAWQTLADLVSKDADDNATSGDHVLVDTHNTYIYSPRKLVAAIGLQDLIVIETEDALLICPRDRSQDVRAVVDLLRAQGRDDLL
jgi:mannose-1-phosphate guanylyltransferase